MDVFTVETFQYDWKDKRVVSQYLLVNSKELGKRLVDEAIKEYDGRNREIKLVVNDDDNYIYMIKVPGVEDMTGDNIFFIGCSKRHVNTRTDIDDMLEQIRNTK